MSSLPRLALAVAALLAARPAIAADLPKPAGERVLLVVWDGMRPDFIRPDTTPNLHALAQRGTFFANNHSAYICTTEVNGTVIATGVFAPKSGIIANREYRPDFDLMFTFATEARHVGPFFDAMLGGKYVGVPTTAELVQQAGASSAIAGTKDVALLHDRSPIRGAEKQNSTVVFSGKSYPKDLVKTIEVTLGKWPGYPTQPSKEPTANTGQNKWTTRALTEQLWKDGTPKFSTLWLGDPDYSQHYTQPGSKMALQAIRDSDTHLGMALAELKKRGQLDSTNVVVVSDHAFSTIDRVTSLTNYFRKAGLDVKKEFKTAPKDGDILLMHLGGSVSLYVVGHVPAVIQKIVDALHQAEFCGPIFTKEKLEGTYSLAEGRLDTAWAPDVIFSFRWNSKQNEHGVPGCFWNEGTRAGSGTHGSLSRYCINNTLVAAGPDIRSGLRSDLPSGNVDVAPTIRHLLGITSPVPLDGRVLAEALRDADTAATPAPVTTKQEVSRTISGKTYRAYLQVTEYDGTRYIDHGNASTDGEPFGQ